MASLCDTEDCPDFSSLRYATLWQELGFDKINSSATTFSSSMRAIKPRIRAIILIEEGRRQCNSYWSDTIGWLTHEGVKGFVTSWFTALGFVRQSYEVWEQIL